MIYSTLRCPSCNKIVKERTNPEQVLGSPFEHCSWCGFTYLDPYKEEWITKSPVKRFLYILNPYVWARAFLIPMFLLMIPFIVFNMSNETFFIIWPILSTSWLIGGYFLYRKSEQKNIISSLERTNDAEYLKSLKDVGYRIYPLSKHRKPHQTKSNDYKCLNESTKHIEETNKRSSFCKKCGVKLKADSRFCHNCGTKINEKQ